MPVVQKISAICHREQRDGGMVSGPDELGFLAKWRPAGGNQEIPQRSELMAAHKPPFRFGCSLPGAMIRKL
jgi:hypothetical protein